MRTLTFAKAENSEKRGKRSDISLHITRKAGWWKPLQVVAIFTKALADSRSQRLLKRSRMMLRMSSLSLIVEDVIDNTAKFFVGRVVSSRAMLLGGAVARGEARRQR